MSRPPCGLLSSGSALVFNGVGTRLLQSCELDLTEATTLQVRRSVCVCVSMRVCVCVCMYIYI